MRLGDAAFVFAEGIDAATKNPAGGGLGQVQLFAGGFDEGLGLLFVQGHQILQRLHVRVRSCFIGKFDFATRRAMPAGYRRYDGRQVFVVDRDVSCFENHLGRFAVHAVVGHGVRLCWLNVVVPAPAG